MKSILSMLTLALIIAFTSCDNTTTQTQTTEETVVNNFAYSAVIQEIVQTTNYTYCRVAEGAVEYWMAISKLPVEVGQTLYFNQGHEMKDFHSKELDRTFPSVYFIQDVSTNPGGGVAAAEQAPAVMGTTPQKPEIVKNEIKIGKADGGITIAELYANKDKYAGKTVKIRGKVTKFNPGIMSRNWVHIQDGSDYEGNFDLTITTQIMINEDATVTFEGVIATDKDFGAGYFYPIIMEEADIADMEGV